MRDWIVSSRDPDCNRRISSLDLPVYWAKRSLGVSREDVWSADELHQRTHRNEILCQRCEQTANLREGDSGGQKVLFKTFELALELWRRSFISFKTSSSASPVSRHPHWPFGRTLEQSKLGAVSLSFWKSLFISQLGMQDSWLPRLRIRIHFLYYPLSPIVCRNLGNLDNSLRDEISFPLPFSAYFFSFVFSKIYLYLWESSSYNLAKQSRAKKSKA